MIIAPYAVILALLYVILILRVVADRRRVQAAFGDGGDPGLRARVAGHGNLAEHAPILLIMLYLCGEAGYPGWVVHIVGVAMVVGRLLHAYSTSFLQGEGPHLRYRKLGMILTIAPLIVMAALLVCAPLL